MPLSLVSEVLTFVFFCLFVGFSPPPLLPLLLSLISPPSSSSSFSSSSLSSSSKVSVAALVLAEDVPAATELLAHVGHFLSQRGVLPLQEGSAHRDLVLLEPPGIT